VADFLTRATISHRVEAAAIEGTRTKPNGTCPTEISGCGAALEAARGVCSTCETDFAKILDGLAWRSCRSTTESS